MNWKNQTIWTADNLDVLRGMNSESADLIYLDPPFNSNRNYAAPIGSEAAGAAFKDTWTLSDVDLAWIGIIAEKEPNLASVIDAAGLAHGKGMKAYLVMMAVRLLEMRRVLKPAGSLYLHCDPTADAYLRILCDAIFGAANFRNQIVWKRTSSAARGTRKVAAIHDVILFYAGSPAMATRPVYVPHDPEYLRRFYRNEDGHGPYTASELTAAGERNGDSGEPWRGIDPTENGRHWASPGAFPAHVPKPADWDDMKPRQKLDQLDELGLILWPRHGAGMPRFKRYLSTSPGQPMTDMIIDVPPLSHTARERVGYPTQKPLELLDRIIRASSDEGDMVLDPFCGCATALVAAEKLNRRWAGIDISPKAAELVKVRMNRETNLFDQFNPIVRTDIPQRTDVGKLPPYKTHKHTLYGKQEGRCAGCGHHFPFQNFTVDHIVARSKGGTDHLGNLQLLCNHCNSVKGTMDQAAFVAKLKDMDLGA